MRKDFSNSQSLGYALSRYSVEGLNQDRLINLMQRKGIALFDLKKDSPSLMTFRISVKQDKKFFAILEDLCYNKNVSVKKRVFLRANRDDGVIKTKADCGYTVKKTGVYGKARGLYFLKLNFGLVLGALLFIAVCVYNADIIRKIEFRGSGSILDKEICTYLDDSGVTINGRFSDVNLAKLSDDVLASNPLLSFAECYKRGNSLIIDVALAKDKVNVLDGNVSSLYSDVDGVVEQIKVYRGTALVGVGDRVQRGTLLVDGFATVKEQVLKTNVIAGVVIRVAQNYEYRFDRDDQDVIALLNAKAEFDGETVRESIKKQKSGEEYIYSVTLEYLRVVTAG